MVSHGDLISGENEQQLMQTNQKNHNDAEPNVSINLNEVHIPSLRFDSEAEAYEFYNLYARCVGFSIRRHWKTESKKDKKLLSRIFCCSKQGQREKHPDRTPRKPRPETRTNCEAQIKIELDNDSEKFVVAKFVEEHNHELAPPSKAHMLRSHRDVKPVQESLIHKLASAGMKSSEIFFYFSKEAGGFQNIGFLQSDCDNIVQKRRIEFLKKGDGKLLLDYFMQKRKENKSFYYLIQTDEDNQIRNCFWCDAKSRIDYQCFGDVVCFDTTYKINNYDMPFAPIVGVNNHKQTVIFGGALISDEKTETFVWLFRTFLDAMGGKVMDTIFTDQASAMAKAIREVLPNTHHRLCIWHIYQNALKNLSHVFTEFSSFAPDFTKCIYDAETENEFLLHWEKLLETYHLIENTWLQGLFELREKWAQVYARDHFCAGMASTQRSESMNNYFKKYFKRKNILREFVDQYDKAVSLRRQKEANADVTSRTTSPILWSKWPVESRASEVYTRKIFNQFQHELKKAFDLDVQLIEDNGTICKYEILSYVGYRTRTVEFVSTDNIMKCSCKKFEFRGILCSHILKVLGMKNVQELPTQYLLQRWSKNAVPDIMVDPCGNILEANTNASLSVRFSGLSNMAQMVVLEGAKSEKLTEVAERGLQRVLDELRSSQETVEEGVIPLSDINLKDTDVVVDDGVEGCSSKNKDLCAPPRKKLKGESAGRIKGFYDKIKKQGPKGKNNQARNRVGTRRRKCQAIPIDKATVVKGNNSQMSQATKTDLPIALTVPKKRRTQTRKRGNSMEVTEPSIVEHVRLEPINFEGTMPQRQVCDGWSQVQGFAEPSSRQASNYPQRATPSTSKCPARHLDFS